MNSAPVRYPGTSLPGPTDDTHWTDGADWDPDDDVMGYEAAFPHLTILADALITETPDNLDPDRST